MKRLLLPLLAAIALPTAVNAEVINLECVAKYSQDVDGKQILKNQPKVSFSIDSANESTIVDDGYNLRKFNTLIANDIFILTFIDTSDGSGLTREYKYEISRLNGNYLKTDRSLFLDPNSPFFNQGHYETVMSEAETYKLLIYPLKEGGICKKGKKVKRMF